jgi:hypothetical protein
MVIGFSDDSLAGIIATILADLTSYWFKFIFIGMIDIMFVMQNDW